LFDQLKGLLGTAKKAAADQPDQVKSALAKLEDAVDKQTGGTHHTQIVKAGDKAEQYLNMPHAPEGARGCFAGPLVEERSMSRLLWYRSCRSNFSLMAVTRSPRNRCSCGITRCG